jgi:hypothetical protein
MGNAALAGEVAVPVEDIEDGNEAWVAVAFLPRQISYSPRYNANTAPTRTHFADLKMYFNPRYNSDASSTLEHSLCKPDNVRPALVQFQVGSSFERLFFQKKEKGSIAPALHTTSGEVDKIKQTYWMSMLCPW